MDWMNRGNSQPPVANTTAAPGTAGAPTSGHRGKTKGAVGGLRWASIALLFSATILIVASVWFLGVGGKNEASYVKGKQMQAVFLSGGQVYFGKIKNLDDKFMRLSDIYYLRVNQQVQPNQQNSQQATQNDISLVKLGCELHGPNDEMLINRDQIIFWENLKDDGQVAKAVAEYVQKNPDGQKCESASQQQSTTPTTQTQTNTNTNTTTPTNNSTNTQTNTNTNTTNTNNTRR
jgi:hypothetical protein